MSNKQKSNKVKPQLLKGFRDCAPAEQIAYEKMLGTIRRSFELMGFLPYRTATVEAAEILLGPHYTQDSLSELFGFTGPEDTDMSLRYEMTLSLARFVAANPDLPLPFRGYQHGSVFRVDKPGPGRFREFTQCDLDIVGTSNMLADAEVIAAMVTTFENLGIERFKVRFSNRKILNGLISMAGIPEGQGPDVMRVIDKLEKQGRRAVIEELGPGRTDKSGDQIPGVNLAHEHIGAIEKFLDIAENAGSSSLDDVEVLLGGATVSAEGIAELRQIRSHLDAMAIDSSKLEIDLTIVRGLGYYTGPVFETILLDLPEYGAVFSGGRYDNLVDRFLNRSLPAVGSSVGPDRLLAALFALKALKPSGATAQVLVTVMDRDRLPDYLTILRDLRRAGIRAEIYSGDTRNITKQIKYADKVGIPLAVIAGSDEFAAGQITIKNLALGREKAQQTTDRAEWLKAEDIQYTISQTDLVEFVRKQLDSDNGK
ncbi:MAG: histidine--tRNA ligase [bacterium]